VAGGIAAFAALPLQLLIVFPKHIVKSITCLRAIASQRLLVAFLEALIDNSGASDCELTEILKAVRVNICKRFHFFAVADDAGSNARAE
jgi:hypothetical protein